MPTQVDFVNEVIGIDKRVYNGGARVGSGRKLKEPTVAIRVPVSKLDDIKALLSGDFAVNSCQVNDLQEQLAIAQAQIEFLKSKRLKINGSCATCYYFSAGATRCFLRSHDVLASDVCEHFVCPSDYLRSKK